MNPKTIRYYEDIGVLPRPRRTGSGYRTYGKADRERLTFILKARAIGLTLEEIGDILRLRSQGQPTCGHVLALLDRKIAGVDEQLRTLRDVRSDLLELRQYAIQNLPVDGAICGIIEHRDWPGPAAGPIETVRTRGRQLRRAGHVGSSHGGREQ